MCYNTYFTVVYCAATFFENVSNRSRAGAGGRGRDTIAVWHSAVRSCGLSIIADTIVTMFAYLASVDVRTTIIIFRYDENPKSIVDASDGFSENGPVWYINDSILGLFWFLNVQYNEKTDDIIMSIVRREYTSFMSGKKSFEFHHCNELFNYSCYYCCSAIISIIRC